jgi:pyruvate dehydrogenase E1 component
VGALASLVERGEVDKAAVAEAAAKYRIDDPQSAGPQTSDSGVA